MLGIAVREDRGGEQVALLRARGKARGGAHALHVEDYRGDVGVVAQADEFRHERDARSGGGSHGAGARPSGAERHADAGQFVFGLHDGVSGLAVFRVDAEAPHIADQRFHQRRRWRNGVPGHHRDAGEHAAQRAGGIAIDNDLARGRVHALHAVRVGLGEGLGGEVETGLGRAPVQVGRLGLLLAELLDQRLLNLLHFDGEQLRHHAVVDHVAHQFAQLGFGTDGADQFIEGHRIEVQIAPQFVELERLVIYHGRSAVQLHHVFARRFRIHRHQEIDLLAAADVPLLAGANGKPGGQPRDVRRKHVLSGNRNAHLKQGTHQDGIGGLATRSVDCCNLNAEIVDYRMRRPGRWLDRGNL